MTVIKVTFVVMAIGLVLLWLLGGGIGKIIGATPSIHFTSFADLLSASNTEAFANFHLPGQIGVPQINVPAVDAIGSGNTESSPSSNFSSASPYSDEVSLIVSSARTQSATGQYIELSASASLPTPIDISGWTIESALTGNHGYIPQAATLFEQGQINAVSDVLLPRGAQAIVVTGPSPVGVSFRENECTGYLGTLQPFVPAIAQQCPSPLTSVVQTQQNISALGNDCFQYLQSLPACTFPASPPSPLSSACISTIQTALSYNGCVGAHQGDAQFLTPSWRLYLAQVSPLWGGQHDVIRLLDQKGLVVDVINY